MERMMSEDEGGYQTLPLANSEVAEKGKIACIDIANSGVIVAGKSAAGLIPFGIFAESFTGDGTREILIRLFHRFSARWWENDSVAPVALTDRGKLCYMKDAETASIDDTGRSTLGMVLNVSSVDGVLVIHGLPTFVTEAAA